MDFDTSKNTTEIKSQFANEFEVTKIDSQGFLSSVRVFGNSLEISGTLLEIKGHDFDTLAVFRDWESCVAVG